MRMTYGYHPTKPHLGGYIVGGDPHTFAPGVWLHLKERYEPASMLDIGCGEGHAASWFLARGVDAYGIDGCETERTAIPRDRIIIADFEADDFTPPQRTFDLGWCCEFVEHVDEKRVDRILDVFRLCRVVAMTHAVPGQAGHHHVNCQPPEYWEEKLISIGKCYRKSLSEALRAATPAHWVKQSLMVYE